MKDDESLWASATSPDISRDKILKPRDDTVVSSDAPSEADTVDCSLTSLLACNHSGTMVYAVSISMASPYLYHGVLT